MNHNTHSNKYLQRNDINTNTNKTENFSDLSDKINYSNPNDLMKNLNSNYTDKKEKGKIILLNFS